jgi:protein Mpv17
LLTKCGTAAFIFFSSDVAAQNITTSDSTLSIDLNRALSGATFGIIGSCWLHFWWNALERVIEARVPFSKHRLGNTLVKVFFDQSVGAPLYIYCYFFLTNVIQGSKERDDSLTKRAYNAHAVASEVLWPTMLKHWRLWPFVHTLNFYYVPLQHRVILQNLVLAGWSGYLSHVNHSSTRPVNFENGARLQRQKSVIGLDVVDTRENGEGRSVIVRQTKKAVASSPIPITRS